ncbi:MAG: hypothetical protein K0R24_2387 [Gammaproteobacteria bacterium]|jgi:hypothetical protein|nr:hypothetical protein [Gammaproteobacteria bacterium]
MRSQIYQTFEEKLFRAVKLEDTEAIKETLPLYAKEKNSLAKNKPVQYPTPFHYALECDKSPRNIFNIIKVILSDYPKLSQDWLAETNDRDETPLDIILSDTFRNRNTSNQNKFMQNWLDVYNLLKLHGAGAYTHKRQIKEWENYKTSTNIAEQQTKPIKGRHRITRTVFSGDEKMQGFRAKYMEIKMARAEISRNTLDEANNAESECSEPEVSKPSNKESVTSSSLSTSREGKEIFSINTDSSSFSTSASKSQPKEHKATIIMLPSICEERSVSTASTITQSQDIVRQEITNKPEEGNLAHVSNINRKRDKCAPGCVIM